MKWYYQADELGFVGACVQSVRAPEHPRQKEFDSEQDLLGKMVDLETWDVIPE